MNNKLAEFNLPPVLNVLVDDTGDANSNQGKVPAGHEHDGDTQENP